MSNPVLYIILNKSLNMSPGKAAAQAVHAAMKLENKYRSKFMSDYKRTVIVLEATNQEQIDNLDVYLSEAGLNTEWYVDEGVNEVEAYSETALAVEPMDIDDERREIFSSFKLYTFENPQLEKFIEILNRPTKEKAIESIQSLADYREEFPRYVQKTIKWLESK